MKRLFISAAVLFSILLPGAGNNPGLIQDVPSTPWEEAAMKRADLIYGIRWTATAEKMSTQKEGQYFTKGTTYTGIPYSSLWVYGNGSAFVGNEVSFHTFLSAVGNPGSKMYGLDYHKFKTERKKKTAGCHYGSVCSTTADYILGYPYIFTTTQVCKGYVPALEHLGTDFSDLHLFDAACINKTVYPEPTKKSTGHIMVIYGIGRDEKGTIQEVTVEEGYGTKLKDNAAGTRRVTYSFDAFKQLMVDYGYHHYRVNQDKFCYTLPAFIEQDLGFNTDFPDEICLNEGDRKTFAMGEDDKGCSVDVNVLSASYRKLVLSRDGQIFRQMNVKGPGEITLSDLPEGLYEARLKNGRKLSKPTSFQVVGHQDKLITARYDKGSVYLKVPEGFVPLSVRADGLPFHCLSTGREADGIYVFPIPEEHVPDGFKPSGLAISMAGKYSVYYVKAKF